MYHRPPLDRSSRAEAESHDSIENDFEALCCVGSFSIMHFRHSKAILIH